MRCRYLSNEPMLLSIIVGIIQECITAWYILRWSSIVRIICANFPTLNKLQEWTVW